MLNIAYGTAATIEDSLKGCVYITGVERLPIDAITGLSGNSIQSILAISKR
jgi:hypothetical protein